MLDRQPGLTPQTASSDSEKCQILISSVKNYKMHLGQGTMMLLSLYLVRLANVLILPPRETFIYSKVCCSIPGIQWPGVALEW